MAEDRRRGFAASATLGVGLGGFFDGIVFHQILQVHNMLSARIPVDDLVSAKTNMVWDGLFHAVCWIATLVGVFLLAAAGRRGEAPSPRALIGGLLVGWGLFNVIEGLVDHHLLNVHHVVERLGTSAFDYAFLAWGAGMILLGWLLSRPPTGLRRRAFR